MKSSFQLLVLLVIRILIFQVIWMTMNHNVKWLEIGMTMKD